MTISRATGAASGSAGRRVVTAAILVAAWHLAGCSRDPLDRAVAADTASAFSTWRAHVVSDSSAENRRRVDEALQEIRLKIAGEREIKRALGEPVPAGHAVVDDDLRAKVHGRPLREVLQLGYELRVQRLTGELRGLEDAMNKNAQLVTKPGDVESKHHLEALRGRQMARADKYREEIANAEKELEPLLKVSGKRLVPPVADGPVEMPTRRKSAAAGNRGTQATVKSGVSPG